MPPANIIAVGAYQTYFNNNAPVLTAPAHRVRVAQGQYAAVDIPERTQWCSQRTAQQQFELDVAFWYGALTQTRDPAKKGVLERIFTILDFGVVS
jgi:hypothetical protein